MAGNTFDAPKRGSNAVWVHSVQDAAGLGPRFRQMGRRARLAGKHFADLAVRAYKISMTLPDGADAADPRQRDAGPARQAATGKACHPQAIARQPRSPAIRNALAEVAQLLVNAENPVILADRNTRTQAGIDRLVGFPWLETLHVPICDLGSRMKLRPVTDTT